MSGTVHNIMTKRTLTFTNVAGSGNIEIPVVRALDVTDAKSIDVLVRVHSATMGTNTSVEVIVYPISLTGEEPDADFVASAVATVSIAAASVSAPKLYLGTASTPFGNMIRVTVKGIQPATPAAISITLSIDLVVRDN